MITKRIFSPGFSSLKPRLLSTSQGPIHIYDARVKSKILKDDGHQRAALYHLQRLYEETVQFDLKYSKMIETPVRLIISSTLIWHISYSFVTFIFPHKIVPHRGPRILYLSSDSPLQQRPLLLCVQMLHRVCTCGVGWAVVKLS